MTSERKPITQAITQLLYDIFIVPNYELLHIGYSATPRPGTDAENEHVHFVADHTEEFFTEKGLIAKLRQYRHRGLLVDAPANPTYAGNTLYVFVRDERFDPSEWILEARGEHKEYIYR